MTVYVPRGPEAIPHSFETEAPNTPTCRAAVKIFKKGAFNLKLLEPQCRNLIKETLGL